MLASTQIQKENQPAILAYIFRGALGGALPKAAQIALVNMYAELMRQAYPVIARRVLWRESSSYKRKNIEKHQRPSAIKISSL